MTGKEMTKEEITKAVELMKPIYDIEKPIQELMSGHYSLCGYAYNVSMELTKYKRAFEILKDLFGIEKSECENRDTTYWACAGDSANILTKEEYELLEELMKGEDN